MNVYENGVVFMSSDMVIEINKVLKFSNFYALVHENRKKSFTFAAVSEKKQFY
jgi:hypothetical protein